MNWNGNIELLGPMRIVHKQSHPLNPFIMTRRTRFEICSHPLVLLTIVSPKMLGDTDKRNRKAALYIFYSLALAEASLFVLEKVYWEWTAGFLKLLEKVNNQYKLGPEGMVSTRRFFYDAYSKSINGSVFESLRMDMISFSVELLTSNSPNEQLIGARLLRRLSTNVTFAAVTLRKIGVDICVIERLVEMLNWRNPSEQEIRQSAAEILVQVASQQQNSLRIAQIPGAVESVASLLRTDRRSYTSSGDEICQRGDLSDQESNNVQTFNNLGLKILNELSRDHDNCGKIGNTRDCTVCSLTAATPNCHQVKPPAPPKLSVHQPATSRHPSSKSEQDEHPEKHKGVGRKERKTKEGQWSNHGEVGGGEERRRKGRKRERLNLLG
ncbi:hypothetical protein QQ045_022451 [Rhodiola kirilowii]